MAGEHVAVWDGSRWVSISGEKGDPGKNLAIKGTKTNIADLPATGVEGDLWIVAGDGYAWNAHATPPAWENVGPIQGPAGPQGAKGDKGAKGDTGLAGVSPTITVGTTATGAAGSNAIVHNTGTGSAAVFTFTIPQGAQGVKGDKGPAPTMAVGTTSTVAVGLPATVSLTPDGTAGYKLNVGVPKGDTGSSITFKGTATTWPPATPKTGDTWLVGDPAPAGAPAVAGNLVTYTGTAWLDSGSVKGPKGDPGPTAISVDVGNVAVLGTDKLLFVSAGATPIATALKLGGVKVGANLTVAADGTLAATASAVHDATTTKKGIILIADATAITNKDTDKAITPAQLAGSIDVLAPKANPTFTGIVQIPTGGTAAAPKLTVTGDADTGLYSATADTFSITAGGREVLNAANQKVTIPVPLQVGTITYLNVDGAEGDVITTDGKGVLSWNGVFSHGTNCIFCKVGDDLLAKYTKARSLTPGGSPQSSTNRATLILSPGLHKITAPFIVATHYVDVISLGSSAHAPTATIEGAKIVIQAVDIVFEGVRGEIYTDGKAAPTPQQRVVNCVTTAASFGFGPEAGALDQHASGTFTGFTGGTFAFGGTTGIASGIFTNCIGGNGSFAGSGGTASGTFTNCTGGVSSFGGIAGTASGTFTNCVGGSSAFGGTGGTASGTFTNCVGGRNSFGFGGTLSGKAYECRVTDGTFQAVNVTGLTRNCINADGTIDNQGGYYGTDVSTPPTAGQAWVWDDAAKRWKPGTIESGFLCSDGVTKKSLTDVAPLLQLFAGCAADQPIKPDGTTVVGMEAIALR